jgi:hypothetical protein
MADEIDTEAISHAINAFAGELAKQLQPVVLAAIKTFQVISNDPVVRFAIEHPELLRSTQASRNTESPRP